MITIRNKSRYIKAGQPHYIEIFTDDRTPYQLIFYLGSTDPSDQVGEFVCTPKPTQEGGKILFDVGIFSEIAQAVKSKTQDDFNYNPTPNAQPNPQPIGTSLYLLIRDQQEYIGQVLGYENISEQERFAPMNATPRWVGYPQSYTFANQENQAEFYRCSAQELQAKGETYHIDINDFISREISEQGIYLKWENQHGGYSYWLFSDEYSLTTQTQSTHLQTAFNEVLSYDLKKENSLKIWSVCLVLGDEILELQTLLSSRKVYLYTGFADHTPDPHFKAEDWERVIVKNGKQVRNAHRTGVFDFSVEIQRVGNRISLDFERLLQ